MNVYIYVYMFICIYVYMYICIYVHMHREQAPKLTNVLWCAQLKTQYQFFAFRDDLKDLLEKCATFWNQVATLLKPLNNSSSLVRNKSGAE